MPISLMPLPYGTAALAPALSAETLAFHHGQHHRGYIDKTNAATAGGPLAEAPLEAIIAAARVDNPKLFNAAAQSWNHGFYWASLTPQPTTPDAALHAAIERDFGSLAALTATMARHGADHFASGWVWLASHEGQLVIAETHDGDTLADGGTGGDLVPLLVIDLWEHAYYLDHQNRRPDYLAGVIDTALNWTFAAENLARGTAWTYPSDSPAA